MKHIVLQRTYKELELDYKLIRSRRKTVSIIIKQAEGLIVRAPNKLPIREIEGFLFHKRSWILNKLHQFSQLPEVVELNFLEGDKLPFLDDTLILRYSIYEKKRSKVVRKENELVIYSSKFLDKTQRKNIIVKWYKKEALQVLRNLTYDWYNTYFRKIVNTDLNGVNIREYKRRWGSAKENGQITYNWRIILAPKQIATYVVIHELCHLIEFNHSKTYWNSVIKFDKEYKTNRKWLKKFGYTLRL